MSGCRTLRSRRRWQLRLARRTTGDRMAAHWKSDRRRDDLGAGGFRKHTLAASHVRRCALAESGLDRLRSDLSTVQTGILPLLGRRRGLDRCYGSFDCVIYGLTNSGVLKRGGSEACDEAEMEVNEPIRMRVRVRNWWPPRW